jgi:molybdopterin converting factor small subunit
MRVRVFLFAGLRERAGCAECWVEDLEEGATVATLLSRLEERWEFLRGFPLVVARNREVVPASVRVEEGDELALLPPVAGG